MLYSVEPTLTTGAKGCQCSLWSRHLKSLQTSHWHMARCFSGGCGGWNWLRKMLGFYLSKPANFFLDLFTEKRPKDLINISSTKPQTYYYSWHPVLPVVTDHKQWRLSSHCWLYLPLAYWAPLYALCYKNKEGQNLGLAHREPTIHKPKGELEVALWWYGQSYGQRFVTLYRRWWSKPSPRKRNATRQKWLSEETLQISRGKKRSKRQRIKWKIHPSKCRVPKNRKER